MSYPKITERKYRWEKLAWYMNIIIFCCVICYGKGYPDWVYWAARLEIGMCTFLVILNVIILNMIYSYDL